MSVSGPFLASFFARSKRVAIYVPQVLGLIRRFLYVGLTASLAGAALNAQAPVTFPGATVVGVASSPVAVTLTVTHSGVAAAPQASTQGLAGADYTLAAGGTCSAGTSYTTGQQCTVNVIFKPGYPGARTGVAVMQGTDGSVLASTMLAGTGKGGLAVLQPGRIDTVAGTVAWLFRTDGVAAISAPIFLPTGVVADTSGNLFLSDSANNRLRRVDAKTGLISTVAGDGSPGYSGDHGLATQAQISAPAGLALDGAGDLYFVDSGNHAVRRVDAFTGIITTVAGVGIQGYSGDLALATAARLSLPEGIAFDAQQDLFIADTGNNVVREVNATTGIITTVAGTGVSGFNGDAKLATTAQLSSPWNLAFGLDGSLYIADLNNSRVRKVNAAQIITTVAGNGARTYGGDGAAATAAALNAPAAVVFDPAGNLYIADSANNRVRQVNAATGIITTITGNGNEGFGGDTGPANMASLYGPYALFFDQSGNLIVADMFHNRVRRISATTIALAYDVIRVGKTSPPQTEGLQNDGNGDLNLTTPVFVNAALDPASTTCVVGTAQATNVMCNLGVEFAPTTVGTLVQGTLTQGSDAGNSPDIISVSGQVLTVEPTTVSLASNVNPSLLAQPVVFTATVSSADPAVSGPVTFTDGSTTLCANVQISASFTASCNVANLTIGAHNIKASYAGNPNNAAADSSVLVQTVIQTAVLTLSASPNPAIVTSSVTLTITATAGTGTPTGQMTFYDGATVIGTASLNASGVATFSTSAFNVGTHNLSVQYSGDASNAGGTSNVVNEVVSQATTLSMLGSSNATVPAGTAVTFSANISSTNGPIPTGTVQFKDGGTVLGSGTLDATGLATFTLSTLAPGAHNIVASYGGDASNAGSSSTALVETVQQLSTTTALVSDANPGNAGATLHLTATVALAAGAVADGAITGQVTFTEGATVLGTVAVGPTGTAILSISTLIVGSHPIIATYAGNTNYAGSASTLLTEVIQQTVTTTTVTSGGTGSLSGQNVTLTATVTSTTGIPTGTVNFLADGVSIGQGTLNAQGIATLTVSTLTVGNHTITVVYVGSGNYSASTSTPLVQTVALAVTTLTLAGPAKPVDAATTATFTVTLTSTGVAPTGLVVLHDGGATIGAQAVSGVGTFTFSTSSLSIGTHVLSATYAGDANNAASVSNSITTIVQQAASSTLLQTSRNPQIVGQSLTLTAVVTSTSPSSSGSITFMDGATAIATTVLSPSGSATFTTATLTAGTHPLTAVYTGDTNHVASTSVAVNEQIVQSSQIALGSNANPSASGANVVFTAKVTGATSTAPSGQITFLDGTALLGSATLDATGAASVSSAALTVGTHNVTAAYAGDQNFAAITSAPLLQTVQNSSTQVVLTASANPATYGTPLTFTAAITTNGGAATGNVTFTDGGVTIGSAVLNGSGIAALTISTLSPGAHSVIANYAGDGKASASVSTPAAISVKQTTAVAIASSANPSLTLSAITLSVIVTDVGVVTPGGTVTFTDGSTQLGVATLDASGRASITVPSLTSIAHTIQASYSGDGANFTSVSPVLSQTVTLRSTVTAVTATASDPTNSAQVTLISVVRWTGPAAPTGTVTFTTGTTTIGSVPVDATGVGTLTINVNLGTEMIVASYSGDTAYAASTSLATAITSGPATQFTLQIAPPTMTVASKQHGVVTLTVGSVKGFTDTMQYGCLGLPFAATCTFSTTSNVLAANGTQTVQLTIDTGNPLGAGSQVSSLRSNSTGPLMAFIPAALLTGIMLFRKRRRMPLLAALLMICAMVATLSSTGCADGLTQAGTPAGKYTFQVTAYGQGTGASESQTMTLTVTQ